MMIVNIDRDEGWEEIYVAMHAHNQGEGLDFFEVMIMIMIMIMIMRIVRYHDDHEDEMATLTTMM